MNIETQKNGTPTTTAFGSESGHWYNENGLVTSVPMANGKGFTNRITVKHARKFGLVPSVTGILKVIEKPALNNWKIKEYVRACGVVGAQKSDESFEEYCERVAVQMNRFNDHAAVGTDIHAQIAKWYENKFELAENEIDAIANKTTDWLGNVYDTLCGENENNVLVDSETPFANRQLFFGGTVDWKFITRKEIWFIDFKTTDDDKLFLGDKLAYRDSHLAQLVAYEIGTAKTGGKRARFFNVFIGRLGGEIFVREWTEQTDIEWARQFFLASLNVYKIMKGF